MQRDFISSQVECGVIGPQRGDLALAGCDCLDVEHDVGKPGRTQFAFDYKYGDIG